MRQPTIPVKPADTDCDGEYSFQDILETNGRIEKERKKMRGTFTLKDFQNLKEIQRQRKQKKSKANPPMMTKRIEVPRAARLREPVSFESMDENLYDSYPLSMN